MDPLDPLLKDDLPFSQPAALADCCCFDDYDARMAVEELYDEAAAWNDSAARSNDDGWFYSDED